MKGFNTAQQLYIALGVDPLVLLLGKAPSNYSYTKRGPGRKHDRLTRKEKAKRWASGGAA